MWDTVPSLDRANGHPLLASSVDCRVRLSQTPGPRQVQQKHAQALGPLPRGIASKQIALKLGSDKEAF